MTSMNLIEFVVYFRPLGSDAPWSTYGFVRVHGESNMATQVIPGLSHSMNNAEFTYKKA